ncbi:unnamed protein product [Arctogadus glacialis]
MDEDAESESPPPSLYSHNAPRRDIFTWRRAVRYKKTTRAVGTWTTINFDFEHTNFIWLVSAWRCCC